MEERPDEYSTEERNTDDRSEIAGISIDTGQAPGPGSGRISAVASLHARIGSPGRELYGRPSAEPY